MDVHHVPGFVISHADVLLQGLVQREMVERVFGGEVGRAEIVVAVGDKNLEIFIERHSGAQSFGNVDILILKVAVRPLREDLFTQDFIERVGFEIQLGADVIIERRRVWTVDLCEERVVFEGLTHAEAVDAGEAAVEAPDRAVAVT